MKTLTLFAALISSFTFIHLSLKSGLPALFVWIFKLVAGALSPFLALFGLFGALVAFFKRDRLALVAGLFTTAASVRYIELVTRSQDDRFTQVFGANWQHRIPPATRARMLPARYSLALPDPAEGIRIKQQVAYGHSPATGDPLFCDLWQPPLQVSSSGLGIIYLHGSAWHFADKDFQTRTFFRHLAWQGHVIMDVAYTLAPKAALKDMVGDVKRAIAWMKENASELGLNPERLVLIGGSAGGHLALLSAYTPNLHELQPQDVSADTSVHGVVCYYGFADMVESYEYFAQVNEVDDQRMDELMKRLDGMARRFRLIPPGGEWTSFSRWLENVFGGTPDEVPGNYALGSPINHVSAACPPTLILQGADDIGGMAPQMRRLHQELRRVGAQSIYLEFPATDHAFDLILPRFSPAAQVATYYVERFLAMLC